MKIFEKTDNIKFIATIYQDIYAIEIESKDSFDDLFSKFYQVMEKYGICQGNWSENGNGRIVSTAEWNMCWQTYISYINSKLMFMGLMTEPPSHLLAYGKKPN